MRWQLTLQLTAGLALLFGFGYLNASSYVEPPASTQIERAARSQADAIATDVALEWLKLQGNLRTLARSAADGPVLASLGAAVPNAEARPRALKSALEAALAQAGGRGAAALVDARGLVVASTDDDAARLGKFAAAKDALSGTTSIRFEPGAQGGLLVAAAPITRGAQSGQVAGALVLAVAIDAQRLTLWTGMADMDSAVVVATDKDVIATTLGKKASLFSLAGLGPSVTLASDTYAVVTRELTDDSGVAVRALGLGHADDLLISSTVARVRFLVIALGVLSVLLVLSLLLITPFQAVEEEEEGEEKEGPEDEPTPAAPQLAALPATTTPLTPLAPTPASAAIAATAGGSTALAGQSQPAPMAPRNGQVAAPQPSQPILRPEPQRSQPVIASAPNGLQPASVAQPSQLAASLAASFEERSEEPASPAASAFDEIAAAAFSSPPPARPVQTDLSGAPISPDEDLPMPVEHLQLPGLKEGRRGPVAALGPGGAVPGGGASGGAFDGRVVAGNKSSPATQAPAGPMPATFGAPGRSSPFGQAPAFGQGAGDDPWKNPGAPQEPRPVQGSSPAMGAAPTTPPLASARPYQQPSAAPAKVREAPMAFDEEHYRIVYNEFVGSKARLGEVVDNITFEGFSSKLRTSEKELIDRHGCKAVRFQVLVKDRQVSLRPQLVR